MAVAVLRPVFTDSTRNLPNRTMLLAAPPAQASPDVRCRSGRSKPGSSHGLRNSLSRNARTFFNILEAYRLKSRGSGAVPSVKFRNFEFSTLHPYWFSGLRCKPSHHSRSPQTSFMRSVFELSSTSLECLGLRPCRPFAAAKVCPGVLESRRPAFDGPAPRAHSCFWSCAG